jgi:hypothetical protein
METLTGITLMVTTFPHFVRRKRPISIPKAIISSLNKESGHVGPFQGRHIPHFCFFLVLLFYAEYVVVRGVKIKLSAYIQSKRK